MFIKKAFWALKDYASDCGFQRPTMGSSNFGLRLY